MNFALAKDLLHSAVSRQVAVVRLGNHLMDRLKSRLNGVAAPPPVKKRARKTKFANGRLFQFKITLLGVHPPIWRRIQMQDGSLDDLHRHIQAAMGWSNDHLHEFKIRRERYGDPDLLEGGFDDGRLLDSTTTRISDVLPQNGRRLAFKYEYDFGDSWLHEILFEGRPPVDPQAKYPLCLEGGRACPPEDCGGVWGYAGLLEEMANPQDTEHAALLEWVGGAFDPERFDPVEATKAMRR